MLEFDGHSFYHRNSVTSSATIELDKAQNCLVISEAGTVKSKPDPDGPERIGACVYNGMTTALSASRNITQSLVTRQDEKGIQHYSFSIPCDESKTTVSSESNPTSITDSMNRSFILFMCLRISC